MKFWMLVCLAFLLSFNSFGQNAQNYTLGPGDKIEIKVFGQPDQIRGSLNSQIAAGDTIKIEQRLF